MRILSRNEKASIWKMVFRSPTVLFVPNYCINRNKCIYLRRKCRKINFEKQWLIFLFFSQDFQSFILCFTRKHPEVWITNFDKIGILQGSCHKDKKLHSNYPSEYNCSKVIDKKKKKKKKIKSNKNL